VINDSAVRGNAAIVEIKRLGEILAWIKEQQDCPASIEFRMDHDDQARSPAFIGGEESERHGHIDLPNAAFFASAKPSHRGYST
jgi:hypothetical protein